jgi:hypothetical protein
MARRTFEEPMEDEASADPNPADAPPGSGDCVPVVLPDEPAADSAAGEGAALPADLERRLRKLAGKNAPLRGPIFATTRGWVSRDSRWPIFAARFLDFAVITDEHLVLCSTGFFTRKPRRQVLREPLRRLVVTPIGSKPVRTLRIAGDFSRRIRMDLRDDEATTMFVKELLERTPANPRRRAEAWADIGQLGVDPPPPALDPAGVAPPVPPADVAVDADPEVNTQ